MLDLIAENEERLAPGKVFDSSGEYPPTYITYIRMYVYKCASGKKKQNGLRHQQQRQHSTPKTMATKPSAKMHSKSPGQHSTSTPHYHQHSSTTGGTIRTPRSTPTTDHVKPRSMTHHVGGAVSPSGVTISDEIQLRELFSILKGYKILIQFSHHTFKCIPNIRVYHLTYITGLLLGRQIVIWSVKMSIQ